MIKSCSFLLIVLWLVIPAGKNYSQSQTYQLNLITPQEGAHTIDPEQLIIDSNGMMWLAWQNVVQRFDGRHTRSFKLPENIIQLFYDESAQLWAVTAHNVLKYINAHRGFESIKADLEQSERIIRLFQRGGNAPVLFTSNGWHQFDKSNISLSRIDELWDVSPKVFRAFFSKAGNMELYVSGDTIISYNSFSKNTEKIFVDDLSMVKALGDDVFLVSDIRYQTFIIQPERKKRIQLSLPVVNRDLSKNHMYVYSAAYLNNNTCLLSTNGGLFYFDTSKLRLSESKIFYNGELLRNQRAVVNLYQGNKGEIYLSHPDGLYSLNTNYQGLQYRRASATRSEIVQSNDIRSFTQDNDGNIWIATTNGIAQISKQDYQIVTPAIRSDAGAPVYPSYRQVLSVGDELWIGTSGNGVYVLQQKNGYYQRPQPDPGFETANTQKSFEGSYVWKILSYNPETIFVAGGSNNFFIDRKTKRYRNAGLSVISTSSRTAFIDSSGRLYHGGAAGLTCFDQNLHRIFNIKDSLADKRVAAISELQKNTLLIGTKGLYRFTVSDNHISSFKQLKGFPAERFIYCMQKDKMGMLWMGTDDGIYKYDPQTDVAINFGRSSFVPNQAFNSHGAFLSKDGMMFMGGKNGINVFDPLVAQPLQKILKPSVQAFYINNSDSAWQYKSELIIPPGNRSIDFLIVAPEFTEPFNTRYKYRFVNHNTNWIENGFNDRVRIDNAEPGSYALQVAASNDGITWYTNPATITFTIAAPWYQTTIFKLSMLFIMLILALALWRYITRRNEKKRMEEAIEYFSNSGNNETSAEILWDITRNCITRLGLEDCVVYLADDSKQNLVQKAAYGNKNPSERIIANPIIIPFGKGITGSAAASRESILVNDTSKDSRYIVDDKQRYSELAVPILHVGEVIGVIDCEHSKKDFFHKGHRITLERIAALCSAKIARAIALEGMQEAEASLQKLNTKMREAQFMNLRLQMNPHFLFNTLTSIQYLVISGQTRQASNYLNIFAGFLRALLQYAEATVVSLAEEIRILKMYVDLETLSMDETFTYDIDIDESLDEDDVVVPFMILQPFVENAIHHGLQHQLKQKQFSITIENKGDEYLHCIISDNGIGREAAALIKKRKMRAARHESKGVSIVEQRLQLLEEKTGKQGSVSYTDITNEDGSAAGTTVIIIIPYYNNSEL